jgi:methylmalonyl-CoA mutase
MSKQEKLFEQFPPVSTREWMDKITADLKGADFNKKLVWKTNEGFDVKPFYRRDDTEKLPYIAAVPGEFPYIRGSRKNGNSWLIRQDINVTDYALSNRKALDILMKGVNSLGFIINDTTTLTEENIGILLKGIHPESVEINFLPNGKARELLDYFTGWIRQQGADILKINGAIEADPLGRLMINGNICIPVEDGLDYLASLSSEASVLPSFSVIRVNASSFTNAGSDIVKELAFGLSMANEYLSQLTERGISSDLAASKICFTFGIGSNYFFEIAKLRAARLVWSMVVSAYKPENTGSSIMKIHTVTSRWNKTIYDPYVNLLRTQTEAMSAVLGGTDSLTVDPFDMVFREPDDFSERIARNQQLLLKEEAYFDKTADPAGGSWYIEVLTRMIAENAWKLFVEIEDQGGFLSALKKGLIQKMINDSAEIRRSDVSRKKEVLLGTNQYPNINEAYSDTVDSSRAFPEPKDGEDNIVEPVKLFRGAEKFEKLRIAVDNAHKRPVAFMLPIGNPSMRKARSQFSCNFFASGGYKTIDSQGFDSVESGISAAISVNADIIVICSSDDEYAIFAPELKKRIADKALIVVAGNPPCMDELKTKGIEYFISVKSDITTTLEIFNRKLGILLLETVQKR